MDNYTKIGFERIFFHFTAWFSFGYMEVELKICVGLYTNSLTITGFILHDIFSYPDSESCIFSNWSAIKIHGEEIHFQA